MKISYRGLLKKIYDQSAVPAAEVLASVKTKHNDHRDYYPLIALIASGYLGYTGAVPKADAPFRETLIAHSLQAYSLGPGAQVYESAHVNGGLEELYFYIGPKGIEYFESRRADNKKLLISGFLSLLAGTTVAVISFGLKIIAT